MKKVHITLGIPTEYREWHWLLSPLHREKGELLPNEEIKQIKDDVLACLIANVEPTANKGGKKRYLSLVCEPLAEKKPITSSAARRSSPAAKKLVIDLTSPKGVKKTIEPEPVKLDAPKVIASITEKLTQRKGSVVPPVSGL
ncbi:hypothetical protein ACFX2C_003695 [Malus domestica]